MECSKYYYYDHGTDNCEYCCDICCEAELMKTTAQCETYCPTFAQKLQDEAAQQLLNDAQNLQNGGGSGEAGDSGGMGFPLAALVGVLVASTCLLLLVLFIAKRKAIVRKLRRRDPPTTAEDPAADVPLQPQPSFQHDVALHDEVIQGLLTEAGVQECGKACGEGGNSWRLLSAQQTASYSGSPASSPIQESLEGHQGPQKLVPTTGSGRRTDNTELKTILPSLTTFETRV